MVETDEKSITLPVNKDKGVNKEIDKSIIDSSKDRKDIDPESNKNNIEDGIKEKDIDTKDINIEKKSEKIIIDEIEYDLDETGNAILNGEIKFTSDKIKELSEIIEDDNAIIIKSISELSGINPIDSNGQPINYEWTVEGIAKRESDIHKLGIKKGFDEGFSKFLNANPDIADIIQYKTKFGTISGYTTNIDYSKISITDDEDQNYQLIYSSEIQKGSSVDRAKRLADYAKANNTLKQDAIESLSYLKKNQDIQIENIRKEQESKYNEEHNKEVAFYGVDYTEDGRIIDANIQGSIYDSIVKKGVLKNYTIPIEGLKVKTDKGIKNLSRRDVFDYITVPVKEINGCYYTQAQLDEIAVINNPQEFALRCISNLTGGIESLIKQKVTDENIKIIKKLSSTNDKSKGGSKPISQQGDIKSVKLPIIKH